MPHRCAAMVIATLLLAAAWNAAAAPPEFRDRRWLPEGSRLDAETLPVERLTVAAGAHGLVELGRLAFRAPELLGGNARLSGIACQTCHGNGGANSDLFIPGLSDRPGHVDVAHRLWNPMADDGVDRPLEIPTLQGAADNAPYGTLVRMGSLRDFTRRVIVVEFAGPEPRPDLLDALVEYQLALAAPDTPAVTATDRGESPEDLPRYLAVLDRALRAEDGTLAELVARMIRAALGRMAAQAGGVATALPYPQWAGQVAAMARQAQDGGPQGFPAARAALAALQEDVASRLQ